MIYLQVYGFNPKDWKNPIHKKQLLDLYKYSNRENLSFELIANTFEPKIFKELDITIEPGYIFGVEILDIQIKLLEDNFKLIKPFSSHLLVDIKFKNVEISNNIILISE